MAIASKKPSKQKVIVLTLTSIVVLAITAIAAYMNFVVVVAPIARVKQLKPVIKRTVDIKGMVGSQSFTALKSYGELPVLSGAKGKANPFAP